MYSRLSLFSAIGWMVVLIMLCKDCNGKRNWDYEPLSIVANSKNPDKLKMDAKVERLGRGEFALTGSLVTTIDLDETAMIEAVAYRSSSGSEDDYKVLPWSIPKQSYKEFSETHYKDIVYPNVKDCSNVPPAESAFPLPKNTYKFDKCVANGDGLPQIAPEGYYKVIFTFSGEVDCEIVLIAKITTNSNMIG